MKRVFLFLVLGSMCSALSAQLHFNPLFQYLPAEKFGANEVYSQCWDQQGQLWMASNKGIICYNGYTSRVHAAGKNNKATILSNQVQSMFIDSRNRMWISYVDVMGLTRFDIGSGRFRHFLPDSLDKNSMPNVPVVRLVEDRKNRLWALTWEGGLIRIDPDKGPVKKYVPDFDKPADVHRIPFHRVKGMAELNDGRFLMGFFGESRKEAMPCFFDPEKETFVPFDAEGYANENQKEKERILAALTIVNFIYIDPTGNYWFGTYSGLLFFDRKNNTCRRISGREFDNKTGNLDNAKGYVVDENRLWVTTPNKGVLVVDMDTKKTTYLRHSTQTAGSIADNRIRSCKKDPDGNIWVATGDGGFSIYCPVQQQFTILPWSEMDLEYSFQSEQTVPVNQLLVRNKNQIYLSNENGISVYDPEEHLLKEKIIIKSDFFKRNGKAEKELTRIENFKFIDDHRLFMIHGNTPKMYDFQTKKLYKGILNDTGEHIHWQRHILFRHDPKQSGLYTFRQWPNRIFEYDVSTNELKLVTRLGSQEKKEWNEAVKLSDSYSILLPSGKWMLPAFTGNTPSPTNHFFIYDPSTKKSVLFGPARSEKYFPDSTINNVHLDPDKNVWVLTENGIYRFDEKTGKSEYWNKKLGLGSMSAKAMITDKKGIRWVISEKKVVRWNPQTNAVYTFNKEMGMPDGSVLPAVAQMDEVGKIYVATMNGVLLFDPEKLQVPLTKPKLGVSRLIIREDTLTGIKFSRFREGKMQFEWNQNFLNVELYTSQVFAPAPHRFYYRLIGLDSAWQDNGVSNLVRYSNLPDGNFTLEVKIKNVYGIESEIMRIPFTIQKPFWKTWWFYLLAGALLIVMVTVYIRYRERVHRKRQEMLERKVQERTAEVVEKAKEISHQKDIIEEKNKELTDSIHYAERIQRSILPDEKTLKKNLPKHFVLFKPKDIVSGDFYWHTKQKDSLLWAVVDCTGHGVPGGFMSMLGAGLLNQIVNEELKLQPDIILNELRDRVIVALKQTGIAGENRDGMDLTLCRYIPSERKIQFAGANNPLYVLRKGELIELQPDKQPIGIYVGEKKNFTIKEMEVQPDDVIYMTSDGYADQFGGDKGKKFKTSNFEKLIKMVGNDSVDEQLKRIEETFTAWKRDYEQLDDVCVMGVKV